MKVLVLQHLDGDGATLTTVELDVGETIPDLDPFDVMIVMGGPQDVWQEDRYPWLVPEKAAIRRWAVDLKRPFLGLCLGHQLLAEAVGGRVGPGKVPEVGALEVQLTDAGLRDPLFLGFANPVPVLQWHGAEVKELPAGCVVLARSDVCEIQAFRYGARAYGLQCHVEATRDTVGDWAAIPEYAQALERVLGAGAADRLAADVEARLPVYTEIARTLYGNFKTLIERT
jgi:GMP synthase-like glutamine amidotransferase